MAEGVLDHGFCCRSLLAGSKLSNSVMQQASALQLNASKYIQGLLASWFLNICMVKQCLHLLCCISFEVGGKLQ